MSRWPPGTILGGMTYITTMIAIRGLTPIPKIDLATANRCLAGNNAPNGHKKTEISSIYPIQLFTLPTVDYTEGSEKRLNGIW